MTHRNDTVSRRLRTAERRLWRSNSRQRLTLHQDETTEYACEIAIDGKSARGYVRCRSTESLFRAATISISGSDLRWFCVRADYSPEAGVMLIELAAD